MKPETPSPRKPIAGRSHGRGMSHLPMEWMDPMSWRLPSGMALAEFALQTGFLAPLIMRAPKPRRKAAAVEGAVQQTAVNQRMDASTIHAAPSSKPVEEAPGRDASFWQSR